MGGPVIAEYAVSGIQAAADRYNHSGVTALRFEADWSGLVGLDKAECVVEAEVSCRQRAGGRGALRRGSATATAPCSPEGRHMAEQCVPKTRRRSN